MRQDRADWACKKIARYILDLEEGRIAPPFVRRPKPKKPHKAKCPKSLRRRVFAAFPACEYCGWHKGIPWVGCVNWPTVDRIVAGGAYEPSNVTMACLLCNSDKGTTEYIGPVRSLSIMEARDDCRRP